MKNLPDNLSKFGAPSRPAPAAGTKPDFLNTGGGNPFLNAALGPASGLSLPDILQMAVGLVTENEFEKAIPYYRQAVSMQPEIPELHHVLGTCLYVIEQYQKARASFERALELKPHYPEATKELIKTLAKLYENQELVRIAEPYLSYKENDSEVFSMYFRSLEVLGKLKLARNLVNKAIKKHPNDMLLLSSWVCVNDPSSDSKHLKTFEDRVSSMNLDRIEDGDVPPILEQALFSLGQANDKAAKPAKAFDFFARANSLRSRKHKFDIEAFKEKMTQTREFFDLARDVLEKLEFKPIDFSPIFIVGMPRSGSTLTEQILSSHSLVGGLSEVGFLNSEFEGLVANDKPLPLLTDKNLNLLRSQYQGVITVLAKKQSIERPFYTDKNLFNFKWVGLIDLIFPGAKIIHVHRHPLATCWSNFNKSFVSPETDFGNDLVTLGQYYNIYREMMSFWDSRLPGKILDFDYEKLVEDQETETRRLLDFCGLEFEEQCLDFHRNQRAVNTASLRQVRQKMYKGSAKSWEPYSDYLAPLKEIIAEHI